MWVSSSGMSNLQMFSEFGPGGEGVTKERFATVLRDILLGLGDGLEREPVSISPLNGSELENWARSPQFDIEAAAAYGALDTDSSGSVKAGAIKESLNRLSVDQGMPPQTDASVLFDHPVISFSFYSTRSSHHAKST